MPLENVQVSELKCQRISGDWFAVVNGEQIAIDWDDDIFNGSWEYTHQGVKGQITFQDINGQDNPYFCSQPGADLQLLKTLTLNVNHPFIRWIYVHVGSDERNLLEIITKE